ncbi:MAG: hypothetical protein M1827_007356 [Pycnora praestabilis]|nr:MAG: hypothetical protein M1827_007356 [Pycnora praestabilis]
MERKLRQSKAAKHDCADGRVNSAKADSNESSHLKAKDAGKPKKRKFNDLSEEPSEATGVLRMSPEAGDKNGKVKRNKRSTNQKKPNTVNHKVPPTNDSWPGDYAGDEEKKVKVKKRGKVSHESGVPERKGSGASELVLGGPATETIEAQVQQPKQEQRNEANPVVSVGAESEPAWESPKEKPSLVEGDEKGNGGTKRPEGRAQRFIVFIGNLPFSATSESVSKHFAKVQPRSVRHRTHKDTGKSRGFAFLEFDGYDRMKTCLKLYHHSDFDDGLSPIRKINVELTVGGGGAKSKGRTSKLQAKNEKLNDQRKRRALEEEKSKKWNDTNTTVDTGGIHPSRRGRVPDQ